MDRRRSRTGRHVDTLPDDEYEEEFAYEEEEEAEDSEEESEEEEDDDDDDEEEEEATSAPDRVSQTASSHLSGQIREGVVKRGRDMSHDVVGVAHIGEGSQGLNVEEMDGLNCPICMEPWSNGGEHYPSCLPCGHLYGMSCIQKWFRMRRSRNKCPQCNTKCTLKDVRRIYGSRILVHDDELQKRIQSLEAKCELLEKKDADWCRKEVEWLRKEADWLKREADLCSQLHRERTKNLGQLNDRKSGLWTLSTGDPGSQEQRTGWCNDESKYGNSVSHHAFVLQREVQINGARLFDLDAAGQTLIIARNPSGVIGRHTLTKMSLIYPYDHEDITLPQNVKLVKDVRISPFARLALVASLGKKLALISLESNNVVLNYDLPVPAWSCTWDTKSSHYVYAGLQNGMVLVFDTRQTARALESRSGLTGNPVHTIFSLSEDLNLPSSTGNLLTASSAGLSQWSIGCGQDKPSMVPDTENQGVCVSLAYCSASDYLVATYRPKIERQNEVVASQPFLTPSSATGQSVQGSHVIIKRRGSCFATLGSEYANVPSIRLPKYAIMDTKNGSSFASADEMTSELLLHELPSLTTADRLKSYYPIRDIKYYSGLLASPLICLSENKLQFFSQKLF